MRELLGEIGERLKFIEERLHHYDLRIQRLFGQDERCKRLAEVDGVGPLIATALVAAVGNASEFKSGRELAAYLGLVPRHRASGGRTVLLGISKRGDRYLRTLLVHGARSAMRTIERRRTVRSVWAGRLKLRRGSNVAAVALANKNARVLWALLTRGETYRPTPFSARIPQAGWGTASARRLLPTQGCAGCNGELWSDRHFLKPGRWVRPAEAVKLIRRKCADFHLGPGDSRIAPLRGPIYDCNRYLAQLTPRTVLRWGGVHI
jgi:hypothetical protein